MSQEDLAKRVQNVALLLMDVDGVLTDGKVWFVSDGGELVEVKSFSVLDGAGIALAHRVGLKTGVVSARSSPGVRKRAEELSIEFIYLGVCDKKTALADIVKDSGLGAEQICFMGDEVVDLPAMTRVGFPVAVSNAVHEVRSRAAYVTEASGGNGAVREVIELILKEQGKWDGAIAEFLE
jgi:3-deoxy-D-manno-octulosonate 8-phosphate phosphatase (KDO 8-P phosphatase)